MGWAAPRGAAHVVCHGYLGLYPHRYPTHWFLRGLLNEWGLELQHLNPTRVLHIAGFITICEAFLRIEPHVDLFR